MFNIFYEADAKDTDKEIFAVPNKSARGADTPNIPAPLYASLIDSSLI